MSRLPRIILDTNILVSALITKGTPPDILYKMWKDGRFILITSEDQLTELKRVLAYPKLEPYIKVSEAELLLTGIVACATVVQDLPTVEHSPDPADNRIIATALKGQGDLLVTGDKRDLLFLKKIEQISIVTARTAINILENTATKRI